MDLPPAPTPPANSSGGGDGMGANADRTANLLNLLKFSGSGAGSAAAQRQTQQQQQQHHHQASPQQQYQQQYQQQSPPQSFQQHGRTEDQDHHHGSQPQQQHQQQQQYQQHHYGHRETQSHHHHAHQSSLPPSQFQTRIHQPAPTGADPSGLLAALMRGAHDAEETKQTSAHPPTQASPASNPFSGGSPSADTTSYLLNLLNRPKPSQTDQPGLTETSRSNNLTPQSPESLGEHHRGHHHHGQRQGSGSHQSQGHQAPTNPYLEAHQYQRHDSFGQQRQQQATSQENADVSAALYQQLMGSLHSQTAPVSLPILKKDHSSPAGSQPRDSVKSPLHSDRAPSFHSHHSASDKNRETVSEAVSDIAGQVDKDARNAVERAENKQSEHSDVVNAARAVDTQINAIEDNLKDDPDYDSTEQRFVKDIQDSVQNIVDDAQVADSWESADQEEIVVIEEKEAPPVKVFNFPMKPWITISLQDEKADTRPEFRDESIMDIARLKKDFDQMDRNLYTASQTYMTYGMSKQGGLRVIRQDDGKDAKVFTDTKDRIFNLAMSVTPSDHDGIHRETIIGTGVSGTVYWVQVRDGGKDHIEDTHMEQYGFALPPVASQEGDTLGGVLKTRARASTGHPEFFAVGRGKSINMIWPAYIMQNKLFKPGHDRVVDTEKLMKQYSLKINTGKAGKDFTFAQDDTVVVSLDKAGRVKFWDVRDLTAPKEGCDPRAPMPAHSSLEVKEPLMTLSSTPEGEKPWPTSVLLLDKQRPYQKRCALRYMIVGMKQNHTLQLWDLALGKPVQEFNLPHSKESDAVCSVMYHAATGMIIIGHPTRNSVYFAHLSAPKYNLKSVSQADYIQRLVAQDDSIPQPDSTAVISGVREYSFASRGVLRSLDILSNPAMVQDTEEPTLFELYAMHSKGVACLLIKQAELGWSRENKVLEAVDAVSEGIVTVSKLKSPQAIENNTTSTGSAPAVNGTAQRNAAKDSAQAIPSHTEPSQRAAESTTPPKVKNESKESETPVQSSKENQTEKPERKSRKKKAAAANQAESTQNGNSNGHKSESAKGATNNVSVNGVTSEALDTAIAGMESRLNANMADKLKSSLKDLQGKIDEGARTREESFNKHQLKLLDMVSEVLNENTQKVLESLIHRQFTELVIPAIGDKAGKAVSELFEDKLGPHVGSSVQQEIKSALPHAINRSLRNGDFINTISDRVGATVTSRVQQDVLSTLGQQLTPTFTNIANQSTQRIAGDIHQQYQEQIERLKSQHAADSNKIDQLLSYVSRLTDMVSTMAASQSSLQAEFLKFKQQPVHELPGVSGVTGPKNGGSSHGPAPPSYNSAGAQGQVVPSQHGSFHHGQQSTNQAQAFLGSPQYTRAQQHLSPQASTVPGPEQLGGGGNAGPAFAGALADNTPPNHGEPDAELLQRLRTIEQAIHEERYQEAMIQWIQSGKQVEIFHRVLSRYPPSKFEGLPPLMLLVVMATIAKNLQPNPRIKQEVDWIEMAVRSFVENMPSYDWEKQGFQEVMQSTTQTMQLLIGRLQPLLASLNDGYAADGYTNGIDRGTLDWIIRTSEHILDTFGGPRHYE